MASHLSSIGFPVQTEQDLYALAEKVAQKARPFEIDQGYYLSYQDPSGAAIWLHADQQRQIAGMNPHFVGPSVMPLKIIRSLRKEQDHAFDGSYFAWAAPDEGHDDRLGAYPLVFDAPDFLRHHELGFPAILQVQIAAFAHEIVIHANEAAFHEANADTAPMDVASFIPAASPNAHALISGPLLDAQKRTNQFTGKPFWWLQIQSYAGVYDAVVDPVLMHAEPRPGCVVKGSFWLSGMILNESGEPKAKAGFLRLLRNQRS